MGESAACHRLINKAGRRNLPAIPTFGRRQGSPLGARAQYNTHKQGHAHGAHVKSVGPYSDLPGGNKASQEALWEHRDMVKWNHLRFGSVCSLFESGYPDQTRFPLAGESTQVNIRWMVTAASIADVLAQPETATPTGVGIEGDATYHRVALSTSQHLLSSKGITHAQHEI